MILTALLSGLAGALLSTAVYVHREKRAFKVNTIKKFAANRYDIVGDDFTKALNEIFIVFNDSEEVMNALSDFHRIVTTRQGTTQANDGLVRLYKSMCNNTKVKYERFNDSFFLMPFNIKQDQMQQSKESILKNGR